MSSSIIKNDEKENEQFKTIKKLLKDKNLNPKKAKDLKYLFSLTMRTEIKKFNFENLLLYLMKYFNDKNETIFYEYFLHSCELGKYANIKILLENGLNVNCQNDLGETPLHIAIAKNDVELIKLLIEYEPDTSLTTEKDDFTALNYAEISGNKKIIKIITELDEKNKKKLIKSEIIDYINRDMNDINNISIDNISNFVNKNSNFEEIQNYNGEKMSIVVEEEQNQNTILTNDSKIKNEKNNSKKINKNDNIITLTKKILNNSDYSEGISPKNTIKVINYYNNINNINIINNINNHHNINENNFRRFYTEENSSDKKRSRRFASDLKNYASPLKRKDEIVNYYYNRSTNPSCVQSLTTSHTCNKEQMESPLLRYKTVKSIDRKVELYNFILEINLPKNYAKLLIDNGFDDLEMLISQAKNSVALSYQNLKDIGISLPGDRAKILIHLEELAGNFPFSLDKDKLYSNKNEEKINNSLYIFLSSINLDEYMKIFIENGYYNAELLYIQMISKNPITEDILKNDFGISKLGHNKRIMLNLMTCSENYIKKLKNKINNNKDFNSIETEGSPYLNSCDSTCIII